MRASACIIFNPAARGEGAERFRDRVRKWLPGSVWKMTRHAGHARALAAEAVTEKFGFIIAAGGDGTVNEVVNGIGDVPGGLEGVAFGVLPLGTLNVFTLELGYPRNLREVCALLDRCQTKQIDLGCVEHTVEANPQTRFFVQLAGAGLDARAIELVNWKLKKKTGPAAYLVAGAQALLEKQTTIAEHGENATGGELILIGNGRFYGGRIPVFPEAQLDDGWLHVCVLPKATWRQFMAAGAGYLTRNIHRFGAGIQFKTRSLKLSSENRVAFQLDGDAVGQLPAAFSIRPKALSVIVP